MTSKKRAVSLWVSITCAALVVIAILVDSAKQKSLERIALNHGGVDASVVDLVVEENPAGGLDRSNPLDVSAARTRVSAEANATPPSSESATTHESSSSITLEVGESRDPKSSVEAGCQLCGTVVDHHGAPVRATFIWIVRADTDPAASLQPFDEARVFAKTITNGRGVFCVDGVPTGKWWVAPPVQFLELPQRGSQESFVPTAELVEITSGMREHQCLVRFSVAMYVSGRVLAPDGEPASDTLLEARRPGSVGISVGRSAADGSFSLGPLLNGTYDLMAEGHGAFASSAPLRVNAGEGDLVLRLRRPCAISGTVLDLLTGEVCAARVTATSGTKSFDSEALRSPGLSSEFRFEGLAPGVYDLLARTRDDRIGLLRGVMVDEGVDTRQLVLPVDAPAKLELKYIGTRTSASIEIKSGSVSIYRGSIRAGRLSTRSVPAGSLDITLMNVGGEPMKTSRVELAAGETRDFVFDDTP